MVTVYDKSPMAVSQRRSVHIRGSCIVLTFNSNHSMCTSAEADYSGLSARVLVRLSVTMVTGEPVDRSRSNLVGGSKG